MKRPLLDTVVNTVLIATCILFSVNLVLKWLPTRNGNPDAAYHSGDRIKDTSLLHLRSSPKTLILVTASTCGFCKASMPFYQQLTTSAHRHGIRVIGVTREDIKKNSAYLQQNNIAVDDVIDADTNAFRPMATPTVILLRSDGVVIHCWLGKLPESTEAGVFKAVV